MRKEDLKRLRKLKATPAMMRIASTDIPKRKRYGYGGRETEYFKYGVYIRAQQLEGYLKIAFFLANEMRRGITTPRYEIFINGESGEFITWDVEKNSWRDAKLDMLDWPEYKFHSGIYSNRDTNRSIKHYLKVENGGFKGILDYQLNIREEQLKNRHRRETDPWDQMQEQVPELPKDWEHWVEKTGITENYIFYEYKRNGADKGYCTWCEKTVKISNPKHNTEGKCSCCGRKIVYKSNGKASLKVKTNQFNCWIIQNCEKGFVIRQFKANKSFLKSDRTKTELSVWEVRRIFYNDNLWGEAFYKGLYKNIDLRWISTGLAYVTRMNGYGSEPGLIYKRTLHSIEPLKKTGILEILKSKDLIDPEIFIEIVKQKPYIEKLIKSNLSKIAFEVLNGKNIKGLAESNDFAKVLLIDGNRLKRLRKINGGIVALEWLKCEKVRDIVIDDAAITWFDKEDIMPEDISLLNKMSIQKLFNYLRKQYVITERKPKQLLSTWDDYLRMASRLKMDISSELIYKPRNLVEAHDRVVQLCGDAGLALKAGDIAIKYPGVDNILQSIKAKFEYSSKKYSVIVPQQIEEILKEGEILSLCFDRDDRYFDRINRKESYLLFLRKTESIETPYYVLEVEPNGTVRQKRTLGDKQNKDIDDAKKFIVSWQHEIQKRLSKEDEALGVESAKLRIENFNELRKTKAKIRSGHLAGQLLVDVLEADLMEAIKIESEAS